ncbi:MAG: DNA polymerase I [Bacteroidaceae bacterium]|jgi:DNA polymerase-1
MENDKKLYLLDAYALIYRAYYAFIKNPRINSKGLNTSAIFGFVNTLEEVLRREKPTHIGIAFDPAGPTFRHEAYPAYKAQREETPEAIRLAVPLIKEIINAYHIPILEQPGFEADDVIGTIALQAGAEGYQVFMMTPDKDYGQLVRPNVFICKPKHGSSGFDFMGVEEVKAKFGIESPEQVQDILGLWGDASDNIPGCPGIGEKRAKELVARFGSVEGLLERTDELTGSLKEKVIQNAEQIRFSKFLATIKTDVPIAFEPDALRREEPDKEKLKNLFDRLEFHSLAQRILGTSSLPNPGREPGKQADLFSEIADTPPEIPENKNLKVLKDIPYRYELIDSKERIHSFFQEIQTTGTLAIDTETTSTHAIDAELVGISFATAENQAYYIPIPPDRQEATEILDEIRELFENEKTLKVGQNIKYDLLVLQNYGIHLQGPMFDTMIAHYVLQPELRHNMDYLAEIYLNYRTIHIEELIGPKGKGQRNMRDLPPKDVYLYACEDADVTLKLYHRLREELKSSGMQPLFEQIEMPLLPVLARMEHNGVRIDTQALKETAIGFNQRMQAIEQEIHALVGKDFNISSPKQVGEILFDYLKISDKARKTKSGQYVTSEEELEKYRKKHPVIEKILDYRGLKKLLSTYVEALPQLVNPRTGRIHTSFNQTVTATGRLSSSNPNLQNIPVRDDDGREIRKCFIADDGCLFFSADYSQIELRIMAHLSKDKNMQDAFRHSADIHAATAAKIYKVTPEEVTKDMRRKAKTANFGIIYGISAFGLAERMGVSRGEAKDLICSYFETYPGVRAYMEQSIEVARRQGYVETLSHRRRYLPDINSRNAVVRGNAERNAINAPIQGSAADIIKIAMVRIQQRFDREGIRAKMLLQVHDELNFSVPPEEKEQVERIVIEEMEHAYPLDVPLIADCGWGNNWLEAH